MCCGIICDCTTTWEHLSRHISVCVDIAHTHSGDFCSIALQDEKKPQKNPATHGRAHGSLRPGESVYCNQKKTSTEHHETTTFRDIKPRPGNSMTYQPIQCMFSFTVSGANDILRKQCLWVKLLVGFINYRRRPILTKLAYIIRKTKQYITNRSVRLKWKHSWISVSFPLPTDRLCVTSDKELGRSMKFVIYS